VTHQHFGSLERRNGAPNIHDCGHGAAAPFPAKLNDLLGDVHIAIPGVLIISRSTARVKPGAKPVSRKTAPRVSSRPSRLKAFDAKRSPGKRDASASSPFAIPKHASMLILSARVLSEILMKAVRIHQFGGPE